MAPPTVSSREVKWLGLVLIGKNSPENSDMSKQLRRLRERGIDGAPVKPAAGVQSPSIAFEALRLNCSRKLSICISIELGGFSITLHHYNTLL
ncbi:hypothetical protein DMENIID0001_131560 [Sergentomyia squamirostris]